MKTKIYTVENIGYFYYNIEATSEQEAIDKLQGSILDHDQFEMDTNPTVVEVCVMRKELWDIACDRWDEDDAKALYKVFSEYYDDEHWDDYCSLAFIGTDKDVDDFIFNEFVEINEISLTVEFYLDRDLIVSDWGMDYSREEVTTDEGYTRTVVCREF